MNYYENLYKRNLIRGARLRLFVRLCELSALGFAKPKSDLSQEPPAASSVPAIERRARFVAQRLALLNRCSDDDELRFLDFWARWDRDILAAIDAGVVPFRYAKDVLTHALGDIIKREQ